jgi:hypothetical protein
MLVFLQPISQVSYGAKLPNALAVDLSGVPEVQFSHVVAVIEQAMSVPPGYKWGDRLQPLSFTDTTVATLFDNMNRALGTIPGAKAFLDLSHL